MELLYVGLIVLGIVVLILFVLLYRRGNVAQSASSSMRELELQNRQLMEEMSQRLNKELFQFQHLLHQGMQSDLHTLREDTTQRLFSMEKSMNESLQVQLEHTGEAFNAMMSEMARMKEAQRRLSELSVDIHELQNVLTDKKTRGIFGEIELYSLLEQVMGENILRWGKQVKLSNGTIADCVLYGGGSMPMIVIDSKFPLENYQRLCDPARSKEEQKRAQNQFVSDVKKHITAISSKYIIVNETADFAYLFLPAESLFAYIHANLPHLVEFGFQEHVYLVSPTTLMSYITAIKAIYLNQQRSANMVQIQLELKKLAEEFGRFEKRYTSVSSDFEKTYQDMHQLSITAEKLNKRFASIINVELVEQEGEYHEASIS